MFSSRKIERASYDLVAFRYIAANTHPDHDTLAHFRKTHLAELEDLFVQVLQLAQAMKLVKLGTIALDGTKASASKHKALSHGYIEKLEAQLRDEVKTLMAKAETVDAEAQAEGVDLPGEIARRVRKSVSSRNSKPLKPKLRAAKRSVKPDGSPAGKSPSRPKPVLKTKTKST